MEDVTNQEAVKDAANEMAGAIGNDAEEASSAAPAAPEDGQGSAVNADDEAAWAEGGPIREAFAEIQEEGINPMEALQVGAAYLRQEEEEPQAQQGIAGIPAQQ